MNHVSLSAFSYSLWWLPRSSSEYRLREEDQTNGLLLRTLVFTLKNEKLLLSHIILLYETVLRGPRRFGVRIPKIIKMSLIIYPSESRKAHPNWIIEKHLIRNSKEM